MVALLRILSRALALIFSPMVIKIIFPTFVEAVSIVQIIALAVIPGTVNYMYISKFLGNLKNKIIVFSSDNLFIIFSFTE